MDVEQVLITPMHAITLNGPELQQGVVGQTLAAAAMPIEEQMLGNGNPNEQTNVKLGPSNGDS